MPARSRVVGTTDGNSACQASSTRASTCLASAAREAQREHSARWDRTSSNASCESSPSSQACNFVSLRQFFIVLSNACIELHEPASPSRNQTADAGLPKSKSSRNFPIRQALVPEQKTAAQRLFDPIE